MFSLFRFSVCLAFLALAILAATIFVWSPGTPDRKASLTNSNDPVVLLREANRLSFLDNWYKAGPLYRKAEALFEERRDARNEIYARVGRIRAYSETNKWEEVSRLLGEQLRNPVTQSDKQLKLWCLAEKGYTDLDLDIEKAKQSWTEALAIANSIDETQWAARAEGELGVIAFLELHGIDAVSLLGKARLSAHATGDLAGEARVLSMLGQGYNEFHRFTDADAFFRRAIALLKNNQDAGFPFLASIERAQALVGLGNVQQAKQLLTTVLVQSRIEGRRGYEAQALLELGTIGLDQHDTRAAQDYLEAAAQISSSLDFYPILAPAMFNLAGLYREAGELEQTAQALKVGLRASRRLGQKYYLPRDLKALAELKVAIHEGKNADKLFTEAEDVVEAIDINSERGNTASAGAMSDIYLEHFRLAVAMNQPAHAFQTLERVRGRVMLSTLLHERETNENSQTASVEHQIAGLQLTLMQTEDQTKRLSLMDQLQELERTLAFEDNEVPLRRSRALTKPASLREVQNILRNDELLLEYVLADPESFCIAVTRRSLRVLSLSAGREAIEKRTQAFLRELKSKQYNRDHASELYSLLLARPLSLFPKSRLIISPDDVLHLLPFESLSDHNGQFVVKSKVVSYTPSASILRALRVNVAKPTPRPLLAVGDIDYQGRRFSNFQLNPNRAVPAIILRGLSEISGSRLTNLPQSREEVLSLAGLIGSKSYVLLGPNATETAFKLLPLDEFRVVHLAVHAMADPQFPDRAALILGSDNSGKEDGLLQVREITRLHLNAELVTLSACETAVGRVEGEAGVLSLEDSFLMAGAKAVIASTWNVEDQSTTTLMKDFYAHLVAHEDKGTALAHAKRDLLDRYEKPNPWFWAGFVIVGEASETVALRAN